MESNRQALRVLYRALPPIRRRQAWRTLGLMLLGAAAEVLSVGMVLPFLAVLVDPGQLQRIPLVGDWASSLPAGTNLVAIAAIAFISLFLFSGAVRLLLTWSSQALAYNVSHDLSVAAFRKLVRQPYGFYLQRNSADLLSRFEKIHTITYSVLQSGLQAVIATVIATVLTLILLWINFTIALVSAGVLIATYLLISLSVRRILKQNSRTIGQSWAARTKQVQEALGGIRDILLDRSQPVFEADFGRTSDELRRASNLNANVSISPRILIETMLMASLGGFVWYLAGQPGGVVNAIPTLGALAAGGQRLLPLVQSAYVGWSNYLGGRHSIGDIAELLELPEADSGAADGPGRGFSDGVTFDHVHFGYGRGRAVLHDINLVIRKGERIGIVGKTGSGKSTLMDLLLGLLEPTSGRILVDGQILEPGRRAAWQAQVAHVPQSIYLSDDSIAGNIAFGVAPERIDLALVEQSARSAGIHDFIAGLSDGYATHCGERGVRLSGGQRQRIGIARALYKRATVLVFDEATSALDNATEQAVMASIAALGPEITIVMVAHRLSTLDGCDRIVCLDDGRITRIVDSVDQVA